MNASAYPKFCALIQLLPHPCAVYEGVGPQFTVLQSLGNLEGSQSVIRAITEVCISLGVNVFEDIISVVVFGGRPELLHSGEKGNHGISKTRTDQRFSIHPREEIPCCQMVLKSRFPAEVCRCWNV